MIDFEWKQRRQKIMQRRLSVVIDIVGITVFTVTISAILAVIY